jgi:uncharacterized protein with PIN domain
MRSFEATFRFYEELNDFLPENKKKRDFTLVFKGSPSVKDAIESIGVPHTEVDMILVNGSSVDFSRRLNVGDRVSVYPEFESLDISAVNHLREKPLRDPKFVLDVHLGKLAKYLRMLGFDALYDNNFKRKEIIDASVSGKRTILTCGTSLLKMKTVTRGYTVRSRDPEEQIREVLKRFDLSSAIRPFTRCLECNGMIEPAEKEAVRDRLEPLTEKHFDRFYRCDGCGKVYWKGPHFDRMKEFVNRITGE